MFTWISGLVTSSMMLRASSLDSKATAFSLSCTSQPFICTSKTRIDGHVKKNELVERAKHIPKKRTICTFISIIQLADMNEKMSVI